MHLSRLLLLGCLVFLPVVQAAEEIAEPVYEEKTVSVEQIPKGFICDERTPSGCPSAGNLACIGRTDAGTRFWIDRSMDTTGTRLSLEQLREFEAAFQSFRRPEAVDPSETVIRVYSADGKRFEERKIRFSSPPRDFVLDKRRSAERMEDYVGTDGLVLHPVTFSDLSTPKCYAPIEAYAPIEVVPDLRP